tara:strand:- start:8736 stop:8933 length:198 start_codon:yes stop_codon:yes gene_type:complete
MLGWSISVQFLGVKKTKDFAPRNRSLVLFGKGEGQSFVSTYSEIPIPIKIDLWLTLIIEFCLLNI